MQIKEMRLSNFAKFTDFQIEFGDKITRLVGLNGSGKTTVGLTAIWACFKGIAERGTDQLIGERFRFIGQAGRTANISILLKDEEKERGFWLHRKISKDANSILITAEDGKQIDDDFLTDLLDVSFLSAKHFADLPGKSQAIILGIDVSGFDEKIKQYKEVAKDYRREMSDFDLQPFEKIERINSGEMLSKLQEAQEYNQNQFERDNTEAGLKEEMKSIEIAIFNLQKELSDKQKEMIKLPPKEEMIKLEPLRQKLLNANETNEKAFQYEQYLEYKKKYDEAEKCLSDNLELQEKTASKRLQYIKQFNLPVDGLSVNADGMLELNGKLIKEPYFSKGELELIVAKLHASINPDLKIRFIDDFELLDEGNQKKIVDYLLKENFQIITAEVGEKRGKDIILLTECSLTKNKSDKEQIL